MTSLSANEFGNDNVRLRPVNEQLARRTLSEEPLHGDLPVRPPSAMGSRVAGDRSASIIAARPARILPAITLPERSTGATERKPGVALDDDLRRKRVSAIVIHCRQ